MSVPFDQRVWRLRGRHKCVANSFGDTNKSPLHYTIALHQPQNGRIEGRVRHCVDDDGEVLVRVLGGEALVRHELVAAGRHEERVDVHRDHLLVEQRRVPGVDGP